jgi:hypothetical protein
MTIYAINRQENQAPPRHPMINARKDTRATRPVENANNEKTFAAHFPGFSPFL